MSSPLWFWIKWRNLNLLSACVSTCSFALHYVRLCHHNKRLLTIKPSVCLARRTGARFSCHHSCGDAILCGQTCLTSLKLNWNRCLTCFGVNDFKIKVDLHRCGVPHSALPRLWIRCVDRAALTSNLS